MRSGFEAIGYDPIAPLKRLTWMVFAGTGAVLGVIAWVVLL